MQYGATRASRRFNKFRVIYVPLVFLGIRASMPLNECIRGWLRREGMQDRPFVLLAVLRFGTVDWYPQ